MQRAPARHHCGRAAERLAVRPPTREGRKVQIGFRTALMVTGMFGAWTGAAEGQARRIIDVHLHAQDLFVGPGGVEPLSGLRAPESTAAVQELTFQALDELGVILAIASGPRATEYRAADPDRIWASPVVTNARVPVDSLRAWFTMGRYQALAEFAPQYSGLAPNAPELEPYFALAEELDIPVGIHVGLGPPGAAYSGSPEYRMAHSNPLLLEDVLIRHPDLRLYVMHAGWPFLDELLGLLYAHPQVYIDVGVINWVLPRTEFHAYLRRIVEAGFTERIMFGSDQMVWPDALRIAVEAVESAEFLLEAQKQDIFCNNAARFLRLSGTLCGS